MQLRHLARAALALTNPTDKVHAVQQLAPLLSTPLQPPLPAASTAPSAPSAVQSVSADAFPAHHHGQRALDDNHSALTADAANTLGCASHSHLQASDRRFMDRLLSDAPLPQPTRYASVGHNHIALDDAADDLAASQPLLDAGRPARPELVAPGSVPQRSIHTLHGRAALLHAVIHIEFNAINLALDAIWRYPHMPATYYGDWLRVAVEEAQHYTMLHQHLQAMGWHYGDFAAHNGLWEMCIKTAGDITARMALVPRTLEARGLDAAPLIQQRLRSIAADDAHTTAHLLDTILHDEIGHVAIGNHWYNWLCQQQGLEPIQHYQHLVQHYAAPRPKPPLNEAARLAAGFSPIELDYLLHPFDAPV